jgi:endo-1,4-beta-xylanase
MMSTFVCTATAAAQQTHPEIHLYPNGAPGSEARASEPEKVEPANADHASLHIWNIHNPSITVYLPAKEKNTGTAFIVCPGGGHRYLAFDFEGTEVATWLSENGIAAFILKYRLAREENSTYKVEVEALSDVQRAIRTVRSRADEWNVNPQRIGVMGFSAGGQLAALAGTRFDLGKPDAADPLDRLSSRPDFLVLGYPAFQIPPELPKDIPPTFIVGAADDPITSGNAPNIFSAWVKAGAPVELHIFEHGGHGFGMRDRSGKGGPVVQWNQRLKEWMSDRGLLVAAK